MPRPLRRLAVLFLTAALALIAAGGCSNKRDPEPEQPLTQTEADDLVQAVGAMVATDLGGWLVEVQSTAQSIPVGSPTTLEGSRGPFRIMRDTTFVRGAMNWRIHLTYQNGPNDADTIPSWDPTVTVADGFAQGKGAIVSPAFGARVATIGYGRDSSSFLAQDLGITADTAIVFDGFCRYDTALVSIQDGAVARHYYLDSVVDYTNLEIRRQPGSPEFPVHGEVRIDIVSELLFTPVHLAGEDRQKIFDAVMVITFETAQPQTPVVTITAGTETPTTVFRYRLDLRTGAITPA
jgi:hypothetical protein